MGKFLGIPYNKTHGVFSALIMIVGIVSSFWWSPSSSLKIQMLSAIGLSSVVNMLLQLWNEWFQLTSKNVLKNYGSYKNSIANSKDDMKWWMLGWIGGTFIGVAIFVVIDKLWI